MMEYELKNFKSIKIENGELIIEWDKNIGCATSMSFNLDDIKAIGIDLKKGVAKGVLNND